MLVSPLMQGDLTFKTSFSPLLEQVGRLSIHLSRDLYAEYTTSIDAQTVPPPPSLAVNTGHWICEANPDQDVNSGGEQGRRQAYVRPHWLPGRTRQA